MSMYLMYQWKPVVIVCLYACMLAGCSRPDSPAVSDGIDTQVIDQSTGTELRTHIERDEIGIADRVQINVELEWTSPASTKLIEPQWSESAWELVEAFYEPLQSDEGSFILAASFVLEPFLAGDYTTPLFTAEITPQTNAPSHTLESMPTGIHVLSVLDQQDSGILDPPNAFVNPTLDSSMETRTSLPVFIGISMFVFGIGLVLCHRFRTAKPINSLASVYEQIEQVASGENDSILQGYDMLYHAFCRLDSRLQQTSEIGNFIQECERARFSGVDSNTLDPKAMAQHTLELLGTAEGTTV